MYNTTPDLPPLERLKQMGEEKSDEEDVVESWEDLLDEEETGKNEAVDNRNTEHDEEADLKPIVFGSNLEKDKTPTDPCEAFPRDLEDALNKVTSIIDEAKQFNDTDLLSNIFKKLCRVTSTPHKNQALKSIVDLVLELKPSSLPDTKPFETNDEDKNSTLGKNNSKTNPHTKQVKQQQSSAEAVASKNKTNTPAPIKGPGKKTSLNLGSSKKKYNKKWVDDDIIYSDSDDLSD